MQSLERSKGKGQKCEEWKSEGRNARRQKLGAIFTQPGFESLQNKRRDHFHVSNAAVHRLVRVAVCSSYVQAVHTSSSCKWFYLLLVRVLVQTTAFSAKYKSFSSCLNKGRKPFSPFLQTQPLLIPSNHPDKASISLLAPAPSHANQMQSSHQPHVSQKEILASSI